MFCVIDTKSGKEYLIGDKMELCLSVSKQYKFRCVLEDILENGQVVLGSLEVKVKDSYKTIDGHFKTGVYELLSVSKGKGSRYTYGSIALQYKGGKKHVLVSDSGMIIEPGTEIVLREVKDIASSSYTGIYNGINGKGLVCMSNVKVEGHLNIADSNFFRYDEELTLEIIEGMSVDGYGLVKIG